MLASPLTPREADHFRLNTVPSSEDMAYAQKLIADDALCTPTTQIVPDSRSAGMCIQSSLSVSVGCAAWCLQATQSCTGRLWPASALQRRRGHRQHILGSTACSAQEALHRGGGAQLASTIARALRALTDPLSTSAQQLTSHEPGAHFNASVLIQRQNSHLWP